MRLYVSMGRKMKKKKKKKKKEKQNKQTNKQKTNKQTKNDNNMIDLFLFVMYMYFVLRLTLRLPVSKVESSIFVLNGGISQNQNRMTNSVDPDETAHNEPSHQDLYCLQKVFWYAGLKR